MPATYEPIATSTISGAASTTFSSIPSTYTDLRLVFRGTLSNSTAELGMYYGALTGTPYSGTILQGDGASATGFRVSNRDVLYVANNVFISSTQSLVTVDIFSYANTSINKTALITLSNDKNGSGTVQRQVALKRNTAAISSLTLEVFVGTITGTATLYGIKAA
jgi:hypothetical protein